MIGSIHSVKAWNKALTQEEVQALDMKADKTTIQSEYIKLESKLDSLEEVNRIGTMIGTGYSFNQ